MEGLPVYDNHFHMSPSGRNVDALREFEREGGTGITLVTLPYREVPIRGGADFARSYEITYDLAAKARESTSVEVNVAVGPYPVLIVPLAEAFGLDKAKGMLIEGMEAAGEAVAEGKAAAIGEIGRPHFGCERDIWDASNEVLARGMEIARENGCPVIIHSESSPDTDRSLAEIARKVGLDPGLGGQAFLPAVRHPRGDLRRHAVPARVEDWHQEGTLEGELPLHDRDGLHRRSGKAVVGHGLHHRAQQGQVDAEFRYRGQRDRLPHMRGHPPIALQSPTSSHAGNGPRIPGGNPSKTLVVEQHVRFWCGPRRKSMCRTSPEPGGSIPSGAGRSSEHSTEEGGGHGDTPFRGRPLLRDVCSFAGGIIFSQWGIFTNFNVFSRLLEKPCKRLSKSLNSTFPKPSN